MPTPNTGESQRDFVARCIPIVLHDRTAEDGAQAVAICHSLYRQHQQHKTRTPGETKATINRGDVHARLRGALDPQEPKLVRILGQLRRTNQDAVTISYAELEQALMGGNVSHEWLAAWRQSYSAFVSDHLDPTWRATAQAAAERIGDDVNRASEMPHRYTPTGSRVTAWVEARGAERVVQWTEAQVGAARTIISSGMDEGIGARELGRRLRAVTGLHEKQAQAVERMRSALTAEGQAAKQVAAGTERYASYLHRVRANTIARTELAYAYNRGQEEAVREAEEQGFFTGPVEGRFSTAEDELVCEECAGADGMVVGAGGAEEPPLHPNCRCEIVYSVLE